MSDPELRVCLDLNLASQFQGIAEAKAAEEHSDEPSTPFEAALVKSKRWRKGRTLKIRFMDGDAALQNRVAQSAKEWMKYANVNFDFGTYANAEIRIAFVQGAGSWSAVGTDALVEEWFPKNEQTMNYGWLRPTSTDQEVSSVVLHEFGHALGLIHEHQQPSAEIQVEQGAHLPPARRTAEQLAQSDGRPQCLQPARESRAELLGLRQRVHHALLLPEGVDDGRYGVPGEFSAVGARQDIHR